ncbi:MAG: hypothetical protein WA324_00770 [Bryobacteraceae bacterium]
MPARLLLITYCTAGLLFGGGSNRVKRYFVPATFAGNGKFIEVRAVNRCSRPLHLALAIYEKDGYTAMDKAFDLNPAEEQDLRIDLGSSSEMAVWGIFETSLDRSCSADFEVVMNLLEGNTLREAPQTILPLGSVILARGEAMLWSRDRIGDRLFVTNTTGALANLYLCAKDQYVVSRGMCTDWRTLTTKPHQLSILTLGPSEDAFVVMAGDGGLTMMGARYVNGVKKNFNVDSGITFGSEVAK